MKKIMSLILFASLLLACNSTTSDEKTTVVNEQDTATSVLAEEEHAHAEIDLTLNNGAKWNGDEATDNNVKNLETILADFKPSSAPSTAEYVNLSNNLQAGLDKLIQDCRMKGPDHDALHAWLEPLIGKVKNLKQTTDANAAATATEDINKHVHLYHDYFE